ncbi:exomer complex subunit KNAG_0G03090 [Huiozyma naganishii CBS 8797]|uniref:Uncharacterized protein n=1 Tax=Huiozyma naganishii (strain ATCC MYA-139 / BCRC 22969 / CBS 8797 / KCTC 17520 / NBRC 10181 / NCYC 3082 / Yp74L-3) TaxID=1071383 RepID=J7S981_HUIN7|nr:hypothetical protein KNAG_0G03090 [Kazachstania naganishii CBS 8797]CCK71366.1 hypothetical protein KNAG_0G03090 [Kazachstania naganishii CBS 8797]
MISQCSIPEVKEEVIGYALDERKQRLGQFQDLGPPDLITLVKYLPSSGNTNTTNTPNTGAKADSATLTSTDPSLLLNGLHSHDKLKGEVGTFFYSVGADTSDPASITIFLKNIADLIAEEPQNWFSKKKSFQVARISLSTWNSFRKCDMNIVVHMPGTVSMFVLDSNGEQLHIDPESDDGKIIWAEVFVSDVARALMLMKDNYEDGESQHLVETVIINPLSAGEIDKVADTFIKIFPIVYENGEFLGSPCDVINVSKTNNYLAETLLEVVSLTNSVAQCKEMLLKLMERYPEALILLVRVMLANDMEIDAIQLIHNQLEEIENYDAASETTKKPLFPLDYKSELLCVEAEFLLMNKKDFKLAQMLAQSAVNCAPSEFKPWHLLTNAYIKLNDIENALLSLNACPMSSLKEKYILKRIVPFPADNSLHLPLPVDVLLDEVTTLDPQEVQKEHQTADQALVNLAAANLKSTFQIAYKSLTSLVQITGWETLLRIRSKIFVMEDEYQNSSEELHNPRVSNDGASLDTSTSTLRVKRLCERWLDNLFMLLYEDLKTYTMWQSEQLYFEAQNSSYTKLTFEWELYGLCARRLGHFPEAARSFQQGLLQRFSPQSARKLLEYCVNERERVRQLSNVPNSKMTSSQIMTRVSELDSSIIDLCVKIYCWNHRWYIEFSRQVIQSMAVVIQDLGITKVSNEIASKYPETVAKLMKDDVLDFFTKYTNDYYDL